MSKHTPGPWSYGQTAVGAGDFEVTSGQRPYVATVHWGYHPTAEANARLIAAAPELLAALYELAEYLAGREDVVDGDCGQPAPNREMTLLREVRYAIEKATGESA